MDSIKKPLLFLLFLILSAAISKAPDISEVREPARFESASNIFKAGSFSERLLGDDFPPDWTDLTFMKFRSKTEYTLVENEGVTVVRAFSPGKVSAKRRDFELSPEKYPILHWRWKAENLIPSANIQYRKTDDATARLMIGFRVKDSKQSVVDFAKNKTAKLITGYDFNTRVLNYIWDNRYPEGSVISREDSDLLKYIVVESGEENLGKWVEESRDVVEDFKKVFGMNPEAIIAVGILTDSDATGETVTAYYGDITLGPKE